MKNDRHQDFMWWLKLILAPVGIIGGPIAIADTLAGVIRWHGFIGYIITFWDEHVSAPFGKILASLLALVNVPPPSEFAVDYLTLGILFFGNSIRARDLMMSREEVHHQRYRGSSVVGVILRSLQIMLAIALWPLVSLLFLLQVLSFQWDQRFGTPKIDFDGYERARLGTVALAPFAVFIALWLANIAWGTWVGDPTAR